MRDEQKKVSTPSTDKQSEADIFFMLSRELLTIADFKGYFKRLNPFWEQVLGYSLDELYASPFIDFIHPEDRASTLEQMGILSEGQDVVDFENRYIAKDGSERWLLWSAHSTLEDQLIYAIAHDITERKLTEVELLNTSAALENAVEGMAKVDAHGRFTFINHRFAEHLGYKPEELLGAHWHVSVHPDDISTLKHAYERMLVESKSEIEARGITRDGELSHSQIVLVKAFDERKRFVGHHCFMKDITARKQAEASLKETESKLSNLLRHVPGILYQMVLHKDKSFSFPYMSESCRKILGYAPSEFQANSDLARQCIHPDDIEPIKRALLESSKKLSAFRSELRFHTKSNDLKWVLLSSSPERLVNGDTLWNGLLTDITELKSAEAKITQLNEDLAQRISVLGAVNQELEILTHKLELAYDEALEASKLKSEFVANISHEVRTPISAVIGMAELLSESNLSTEQRQFVNIVSDSANSLLAIINDILDFSKMEAGRIELEIIDFNLIAIVQGCADWLKSAAKGKKLELSTKIDPSIPPHLKGDPIRLRQILLNLASNAIKFTAQGRVVLTAYVVDKTSDSISVHFEVSDTGIGISEASKNRLFQPFSQADGSTTRKYGGTGLGLSISKRLVELMGGAIAVESEELVGSKFWFTLPFKTSPPIEGSEETAPGALLKNRTGEQDLDFTRGYEIAPASDLSQFLSSAPDIDKSKPNNSQKWVLLAEDNPVLQNLAKHQLNKLGFHVRVASNGRETLKACHDRDYALIFMDCQMPEMDGFQAAMEIRRQETNTGKHSVIIALTASAMPSDRQKCLASGMDDYLSKPVSFEQLLELVRRWLPSAIFNGTIAPNPLSTKNGELSKIGVPSELIIDIAQLERLYGEDSVSEILSMFLGEAKSLIADIDESLNSNDRTKLAGSAHQLKGVSSAVLTKRLNDLSEQLERNAAQGTTPEIESVCIKLKKEFDCVTNFVEMLLKKHSHP